MSESDVLTGKIVSHYRIVERLGGGAPVWVIDPVDGSTNASKGIPWFATSLCAVDGEGARAALVVNQASGVRFEAVRGGGARRDGVPIRPSGCERMSDAIVAMKMSTGEILWFKQMTSKDAWNSSCYLEGKVNCPDSDGPDFDFAAPPILQHQADGRDILIAISKAGTVYAFDPNQSG